MQYIMTDLIRASLYAHFLKDKKVLLPEGEIRCNSYYANIYLHDECMSTVRYSDIDDHYVQHHWTYLRHALHGGLDICYQPGEIFKHAHARLHVLTVTAHDVLCAPLRVVTFTDARGKNELITTLGIPEVACALESGIYEKEIEGYAKTYMRLGEDDRFEYLSEEHKDDPNTFCMFYPETTTVEDVMSALFTPMEESASAVGPLSDLNTPLLRSVVAAGNFSALQEALQLLDRELPDKLELILSNTVFKDESVPHTIEDAQK